MTAGIDPIETVEMHTGGEPVRIIVSGYPKLSGATPATAWIISAAG